MRDSISFFPTPSWLTVTFTAFADVAVSASPVLAVVDLALAVAIGSDVAGAPEAV